MENPNSKKVYTCEHGNLKDRCSQCKIEALAAQNAVLRDVLKDIASWKSLTASVAREALALPIPEAVAAYEHKIEARGMQKALLAMCNSCPQEGLDCEKCEDRDAIREAIKDIK